jgi:hypothetical protein
MVKSVELFCGECGQPVTERDTFCTKCGRALGEPKSPGWGQPSTWSYALIAFATLWNWGVAWAMSKGELLLSPFVLGRAFAYVVICLVIAYIARGTGKRRSWQSFARWYFWCSLILTSLIYSGKHLAA